MFDRRSTPAATPNRNYVPKGRQAVTDYMLTIVGGLGARDVQVNNAGDIHEAIELAEAHTGARVDHGRGGIGSKFDPAIVIDAETGEADVRHDKNALLSMQVVGGPAVRAVASVLASNRRREGVTPP